MLISKKQKGFVEILLFIKIYNVLQYDTTSFDDTKGGFYYKFLQYLILDNILGFLYKPRFHGI